MHSFLEYLESIHETDLSEKTATRVLPSFRRTLSRYAITEFSEITLRLWIVDMLLSGISTATARRYLGALHTLYKKYALTSDISPENQTAVSKEGARSVAQFPTIPEIPSSSTISSQSFILPPASSLINKAFLFLLYNPQITLDSFIRLKREDYESVCPQTDDILDSLSLPPEQKYLFPLRQGRISDRTIARELTAQMHELLGNSGLHVESFSRDTVTALWINAALEEGVTPKDIAENIASIPQEYSPLKLLDSEKHPDNYTLTRVAEHINPIASRWFILRLRRGTEFREIQEAVKATEDARFSDISYYYPQYKQKIIDKKTGKRRTKEIPYLTGILFIRLRSDYMTPLMAKIGDLAWCYRYSPKPGSPYCTISPREMRVFQTRIGEFSPDVSMQLTIREDAIAPGDKVLIESGPRMAGHVGTVTSVRNTDGTRTYTLAITTALGVTWTVTDIPGIHLTPTP